MTLTLFLILIVIGLVLFARRRIRGGMVLSLLALAWLFFAGCGPLTGMLLGHLQSGFAPDFAQ